MIRRRVAKFGRFERLLRRLVSAAAFEVFDERGESFFADMVFHAFRIQMGGGIWNTERLEEFNDNLVTPA